MLPQALVIGAGVVGLTTALRLLDAGFSVRIWTAHDPLATTSAVAAAVWYPYRAEPHDRVLAWGRHAAGVFAGLVRDPGSGVRLEAGIEVVAEGTALPWWRTAVPDLRLARSTELPAGAPSGWSFTVPVVEMPRYLPWLLAAVEARGGVMEHRVVHDPAEPAAVADIVVGCLGLGARDLHGDHTVVPVRGQIVRVSNPGLRRVLIDQRDPVETAYVVPRSADVICGGTAEEDRWDTEPDPATGEDILARCRALEPALADARVLEHRAGLRPVRAPLRLEADEIAGRPWIHNYGHGGAGVTLSWGCAEEIVRIARTITGAAGPSG